MGKENVILVAGGSPNDWPDLSSYTKEKTHWIGIDRGALYLLERGILADYAIGDFDSLSSAECELIHAHIANVQQCLPEKDDTDTQLALALAIQYYPNAHYILIGGTKGRIDHFLSNFWLPFEARFQSSCSRFSLVDQQNTVSYFLPGEYTLEKETDKKYLAFVCMTPVKELSLRNVKYELDKYNVSHPTSFTSNEFKGEVCRFSFKSGLVSTIQSKD